jgi:hypothetical protein
MNASSRTLIMATVGLFVVAAVGYVGYSAFKTRELNKASLAALTDTNARLREALSIEVGPPPVDRAQIVKKLDEHAAAADRHLQEFKRLDAARNRALADAADYYLLGAREILKKQADSHRYRLAYAESSRALREHMRSDNRTSAWFPQAVKVKERVNKDYRGYNLNAVALGQFLETLSAAQKRIAPYIEPSALLAEDLIARAHKQVVEETERTADGMEKLNRLDAIR